jgi:hypothetical protein
MAWWEDEGMLVSPVTSWCRVEVLLMTELWPSTECGISSTPPPPPPTLSSLGSLAEEEDEEAEEDGMSPEDTDEEEGRDL